MTNTRIVAPLVVCMWVSGASAQTLTANTDRVAPGTAIELTITGPPGANYIVVGSSVGSGLTVLGVPLQVGPDARPLAIGVLDSTGQATASVVPPFLGSTLDRFYFQAGFSPSPSFNPFTLSPGLIVRNADLLGARPTLLFVTGGMIPGTSVARAFCPPGMRVQGGGGLSANGAGLQQNYPIADDTGLIATGSTAIGWQVAASDWSAVQASVICMAP